MTLTPHRLGACSGRARGRTSGGAVTSLRSPRAIAAGRDMVATMADRDGADSSQTFEISRWAAGPTADLVGDGAHGLGQGVGVGPHQHVGAVAEEVGGGADLADVVGVADHVGRRRVAQPVRGEPRHASPGDEPLERLVEVARRDRRAGLGGDDEVVVDPAGPAARRSSAWNLRCAARPLVIVEGSIGIVRRSGRSCRRTTPGGRGPRSGRARCDGRAFRDRRPTSAARAARCGAARRAREADRAAQRCSAIAARNRCTSSSVHA